MPPRRTTRVVRKVKPTKRVAARSQKGFAALQKINIAAKQLMQNNPCMVRTEAVSKASAMYRAGKL
jgi:hypothetical protein